MHNEFVKIIRVCGFKDNAHRVVCKKCLLTNTELDFTFICPKCGNTIEEIQFNQYHCWIRRKHEWQWIGTRVLFNLQEDGSYKSSVLFAFTEEKLFRKKT